MSGAMAAGTKERLYTAALELFTEHGYEQTSVDEIAEPPTWRPSSTAGWSKSCWKPPSCR